MFFDWDTENIPHIARHRVTPEEVEQALFSNPVDYQFQEVDGEERTLQIGITRAFRFLAVATTLRSGKIRVITAYTATPKQQTVYLKHRASYE